MNNNLHRKFLEWG